MKAKSFIKILVVFLAASLIVACGKKNETDQNPFINGIQNPISVALTGTCSAGSTAGAFTFQEFANQVAACKFSSPSQQGTLASYTEYTGVTDMLNFQVDNQSGWSFDWCWGSDCFDQSALIGRRLDQGNLIYRSANFGVDNEMGNNLQEMLNAIVTRMRAATNVKKCVWNSWYYNFDCRSESEINFEYGNIQSPRYYFEYNNRAYIIDTRYPLIANPVGIQDKDTEHAWAVNL
ncbi:MAG: hypothetical protein HN576_11805 [Bacteriovoracaceae bacterium]|jgi:hypothetical protein|nr:hypothetical protein [Bacteriovoracaceae bacterium]